MRTQAHTSRIHARTVLRQVVGEVSQPNHVQPTLRGLAEALLPPQARRGGWTGGCAGGQRCAAGSKPRAEIASLSCEPCGLGRWSHPAALLRRDPILSLLPRPVLRSCHVPLPLALPPKGGAPGTHSAEAPEPFRPSRGRVPNLECGRSGSGCSRPALLSVARDVAQRGAVADRYPCGQRGAPAARELGCWLRIVRRSLL